MTLCVLAHGVRLAVVGSHGSIGRIAKIRASSHGWEVIGVTREDRTGFLRDSPSVCHIIVDGTLVSPRGVQMLRERHPHTPVDVAYTRNEAITETDRIFGRLI